MGNARAALGVWLVVWLLGLAACGPRARANGPSGPPPATAVDAGPARGDVPCGTATCGPDEYCENKCTCCGMRMASPAEASGEQRCRPLPDSCRTGNGPECQQRTVDLPCA